MSKIFKLAALVGAAYVVYDYINKEGNEELKKKVDVTIEDAKKACVSAANIVVTALNENADAKKVIDKSNEYVNLVKEKADEYKVEEKFNAAKEKGTEIYNTVKENIVKSDVYNNAVEKGTELYNTAKEKGVELYNTTLDQINNNETVKEVKEKGTGLFNTIKDTVSNFNFFKSDYLGTYELKEIEANGKVFNSDEFVLLDIKEAKMEIKEDKTGTIEFKTTDGKETKQEFNWVDDDGLKLSLNESSFLNVEEDGDSIKFESNQMKFTYKKI